MNKCLQFDDSNNFICIYFTENKSVDSIENIELNGNIKTSTFPL